MAIELEHKPTLFGEDEATIKRRKRRKSSRQQVATMTMARDESALMSERGEMKAELEYLNTQITQGDLKRTEKENIENDIRSLEVILAQFSD